MHGYPVPSQMVHGPARPAPGYAGGQQASSLHARRPRVPPTSPGASNGATLTPRTWTLRHHRYALACLVDIWAFSQRGRMAIGTPTSTRLSAQNLGAAVSSPHSCVARRPSGLLQRGRLAFGTLTSSRRRGSSAARQPSLSGMPQHGQLAMGPREATPRSRDGQSRRGSSAPRDGARLA